MWPSCLRLGVAAITYIPMVRTNLSDYPNGEPKQLWDKLAPTQKASLRRVAYEMKPGDTIYVKQGAKIVGKGVVKGSYKFDSKFRIVDPNGYPWAHQVPVEWVYDFPETKILLGAEQLTVKELSNEDVNRIEKIRKATIEAQQKIEAIEGEIYQTETIFRRRNRSLIQAKKANSNYRCETCGFNFEEKYGMIGKEYIIAHHLKPVSLGPTTTTLDDIALLCANCHAMVHKKDPPFSVEELRKRLKQYSNLNE